MAAVLASLLVVALLGAMVAQSLVVQHRQARLNEQCEQSFWLAESAMQRAVHALAQSAGYRGETWQVPAEALGGEARGSATIRVEPTEKPEKGVWIRVEARYPDVPLRRVVHNRDLFVPTPSSGASP